MAEQEKPLVVITGCAGNLGSSLVKALQPQYRVIGLDRSKSELADDSFQIDLTSADSVQQALRGVANQYGKDIAAVIHLAAYFDFTGEHSPLYDKVNVGGTQNLLHALNDFRVERFIYSGTMLVHRPGKPGEKITEDTPIEPGWAYPKSKAQTEEVIKANAQMPWTLLHLAGLYDEETAVPTLSHQIARIYEQDFKSHLYAGDLNAGQAFIHREDLMDLFVRVVDRRRDLPQQHTLLAGEEHVIGYEALQNRIGTLIHGEQKWETVRLPGGVAKAGAWIETKAEPIVPDSFDKGEEPFIKPFMIDLASAHYDLDCSRARELLGWKAQHNIFETLRHLVNSLKRDPLAWYKTNGITPPDWMEAASERKLNPDDLIEHYRQQVASEHRQYLWAHFLTMGLGAWLIASPITMAYSDSWLGVSDIVSGIALLIFGFISLSWRFRMARWGTVAVGIWLMLAPLAFWTPNAAGYLNGTLIGFLAIGFAGLVPPIPGVSPMAEMSGPTKPPGWDANPSSWFQRAPIIILAFVGLLISRYMGAYQLEQIDSVWDPFFSGTRGEGLNGTEDIITSSVSKAWPVPDAGLGAMVYALEILTGFMGSTRRWRTMPWLVILFGFMIVPLGAVSITFIIIQPIVLGTWCTVCLIAAAAMLIQIPYSVDELVATGQFLLRRYRQGKPVLKIFFVGDTDEGPDERISDDFSRRPGSVVKDMFTGGVGLPWSMTVAIAVGLWLMLTRITLGHGDTLANWEHLIGALIITVSVCATAEVARPARYLLIPLAIPLLVLPFIVDADATGIISNVLAGVIVIAMALIPLPVKNPYGNWDRLLRREKILQREQMAR
jgi:nucleoside-diphosphate-sugar epimerase/uncharacterized membrane protein